jgi:hypothetical protein
MRAHTNREQCYTCSQRELTMTHELERAGGAKPLNYKGPNASQTDKP